MLLAAEFTFVQSANVCIVSSSSLALPPFYELKKRRKAVSVEKEERERCVSYSFLHLQLSHGLTACLKRETRNKAKEGNSFGRVDV